MVNHGETVEWGRQVSLLYVQGQYFTQLVNSHK